MVPKQITFIFIGASGSTLMVCNHRYVSLQANISTKMCAESAKAHSGFEHLPAKRTSGQRNLGNIHLPNIYSVYVNAEDPGKEKGSWL